MCCVIPQAHESEQGIVSLLSLEETVGCLRQEQRTRKGQYGKDTAQSVEQRERSVGPHAVREQSSTVVEQVHHGTCNSIITIIFILIQIYLSPNIVRVIKSRRLRWAGHVARMEEGRSDLKILTGKLTGKRPSGRPKYRWEENVRMNLKDTGANTRK